MKQTLINTKIQGTDFKLQFVKDMNHFEWNLTDGKKRYGANVFKHPFMEDDEMVAVLAVHIIESLVAIQKGNKVDGILPRFNA